MKSLSERQIEELADILLGTARAIESGLNQMNIDLERYDTDTIEDELTDHIELCQGCEWWCEPGELAGTDEEDEPGYCDQCR